MAGASEFYWLSPFWLPGLRAESRLSRQKLGLCLQEALRAARLYQYIKAGGPGLFFYPDFFHPGKYARRCGAR